MSTERRIYWAVGLVSSALLLGSFLLPADRPEPHEFPWHIEHIATGSSRVFGLTLGASTPAEAEQRFKERGEFGLFKSPQGRFSAEVFFEQVNLGGLRSRMILTLEVEAKDLKIMHDRGLRMSSTGGGKKITLTPEDIEHLRSAAIGSLTLIPNVRIAEELFEKRFGKPSQIIREANAEVYHNLYQQHGLDITTSSSRSEKQILQYVSPKEYGRLVEPLIKNGGIIISR